MSKSKVKGQRSKVSKLKLRKGDTVLVLSGKDKGKKGKIQKASSADNRVTISGVNMIKKHVKKSKTHPQGGRIEYPAPLNSSKVLLVCPSCGKPTRIGVRLEGKSRVRYCKKCNKTIGVKK